MTTSDSDVEERFRLGEHECRSRACFDTKTWLKLYGKNRKASDAQTIKENESVDADHSKNKACPLDTDELGRNTWGFLHTVAAYYPDKPTAQQQSDMKQMMQLFGKFYPCSYCAKDFRKDMSQDEPDTRNQSTFSQWMCRMHNKVNIKLGKPQFDCSRVNERWKDGWSDGSCN